MRRFSRLILDGSAIFLAALPCLANAQSAAEQQDRTSPSTLIQINIDDGGNLGGASSGPAGPIDPASPPPFDIVPPLSIYESRLMIRDVLRQAQETPGETLLARVPRLDYMLGAAARYVRWVDETHTTLPSYRWEIKADFKIRSSEWNTYTFTPPQPLRPVNAVALRANHDDVEIRLVSIVDRQRRQWNFQRTIVIRGDRPGHEVLFLPLPTEIAEVQIRCRDMIEDAGGNRPRLFLIAGVAARPESAKQAVYYLQRARHHLREGQTTEAIRMIRLADQLLEEYQKDRRL